MKTRLESLYYILNERYNNLNWWPVDHKYHEKHDSDPRFEIITGAMLTQNTSWSNVEKALSKLKTKKCLNLESINKTKIEYCEQLIIQSGFYKQKAKRLKNISRYLKDRYNGDLDRFFNQPLDKLRKELLSLNGIGPETADSILLYAGNKPIFVVDAYTKRICQRIPINVEISYDEIQNYFQEQLSKYFTPDQLPKVYGEFHAQIVMLAKDHCRKKPNCINCPIEKFCKRLI